MFNKSDKVLFIVESPEKANTIRKIFKAEGYNKVTVMATIGHFTKIKDGSGYCNTGIHPDKKFKIDYVLDYSKKENINKLKEQVKAVDMVYICSDPDREGEAIAWSCVNFLDIPKNKYKRASYQAINKKAIFEALEKAGDLDIKLVEAAHTRAIIDKCIGYGFSGVCPGKSVGRCQTSLVKDIVDREREIQNFKPEKYFDLYLNFKKHNVEFNAKYQGTDAKLIKRIDNQEQIDKILSELKGNDNIVTDIERKDKNEYPKNPFSTATCEQECASKLGLSVKTCSDILQKLYDSGKISYHRTDAEYFLDEFANELKTFVLKKYGKEYTSGYVTAGKADETAQEGHEGLHVLDLNLTPELYAKEADKDLYAKVYKIIYNRTVAAALKPAVISQTTYIIHNKKHIFTLTSNELKFNGYRIVYNYKDDSEDDEEELVKETFNEGEVLQNCSYIPAAKETTPPSRIKESGAVKLMKDHEYGRPSTYASILSTVESESRNYVKVENKYLVPTEVGMNLIDFTDKNLPEIFNIEYTAAMEKDLDKIATGKIKYQDFLKTFFEHIEESRKKLGGGDSGKICPNCGKPMALRKGKYGPFWGCTGYPDCKTIEPVKKKA